MSTSDPQFLVSTDWLADHLDTPDIRILDASWHMPNSGRDALAEYDAAHIPGAQYFDIDEIADTQCDLPHMAPSVEKFISRVRAMGIGDGHRVIVYDSHGLFSAARVWWMFRHFGKDDVAVLDGGLRKWKAEERPLTDLSKPVRDRHFTARRNAGLVRDVTQMAATVKLGDAQIIDARAPDRFHGDVPEPRAGVRAGHIPGSKNIHYGALLTGEGTLKSPESLKMIFKTGGIDISGPVVTTCGSGVTAAIINLALEILGNRHNALYDGSWSEWGAFPDLRVERG